MLGLCSLHLPPPLGPQSELVCCLSDIFKMELLHNGGHRFHAVVAAMVTSMLLLVFVYGDMYCTARWYHSPAESLVALAAGAVLFQGPVVAWLVRRARKPAGQV